MAQRRRPLIDLLFPPKCSACGELLDFSRLRSQAALCDNCLSVWNDQKKEPCGHCLCEIQDCACMTELLEEAKCDGFFKLLYYCHGHGSVVQNKVIFRMKNKRDYRTPRFLASEIAFMLKKRVDDGGSILDNAVLCYVPRRRRVYLETGTDQAKELAKALSIRLQMPVCDVIVRKKGRQKEQKTLSPKERLKNARASFVLRDTERVYGKTVLLIDDIVTTGASMAACVRKLRRAGASAVYCVAIASDDTNKAPVAPLIKKSDLFST